MSNANTLELGMLSLINAERALAGLDPLRLITTLNAAAEDHSRWMLETDTFTHSGADGSSPSDRMEAAGYPFEGASLALENIGWQSARGAEGFEDDVAQVHEGLMASPGHRANILDPNAEDIGIGIEIGTFSGTSGDYEAVMVTQVFGSTEADLSAWVDPGTGEPEDEIVNEDEDPTADETPPEEPSTETPEDDPIADGTEVCDDDHLADVEDDPVEEDVTAENTGDERAHAPRRTGREGEQGDGDAEYAYPTGAHG